MSGRSSCTSNSYAVNSNRPCPTPPPGPNTFAPADIALGIAGRNSGRRRQALVRRVAASRPGHRRGARHSGRAQSIDLEPLLRRLQSAHVTGAGHTAHPRGVRPALAARRLHAGPGFVGAPSRGRASGRCDGRLDAPRLEAVSSTVDCGVGGGETGGQLPAAGRGCGVCEWRGGVSVPDGDELAGAHPRGRVRGDAGFGAGGVQDAAEALSWDFIFAARLTQKVQWPCRQDESAGTPTAVAGLAVQEVALDRPGRRLIVVRQRVADRPAAGGKRLLELPAYRFQALVTNLPASLDAWGCGGGMTDGRTWRIGSRNRANSLESSGSAVTVSGRRERCTHWRLRRTTCACCCSGGWGNWRSVS